ncbi:MAG: ABC transporter substrate-binding protein [Methylococcaceae bacterium]|nr:ABC transporter substrate-binding protein [Methylococcaceae bacterium]MCI0732948.1 ABC transporter substrate-binding protein [Methylococcaceae bacterium]
MPTEFFRSNSLVIGSILLFLAATQALAEPDLSEPQLIVKNASDQLQAAMKENPPAGNYERASQIVTEILEPHVDFVRVSALVLGKHWKQATPEQKKRFMKEFRNLLVRTYAVAFSEYSEWKINYIPLDFNPDDDKVFVKTEILRPGGPPVSVDYRMARKEKSWKVYDVVIEGISFITNYRTTFKNEVARSGSLDSVIERLAQRNKQT